MKSKRTKLAYSFFLIAAVLVALVLLPVQQSVISGADGQKLTSEPDPNLYPWYKTSERPDLSACPSSEERASHWAIKPFKPEELTGPYAFMGVAYPQRNYDEAREIFLRAYPLGSNMTSIAHAFQGFEDRNTMSTLYPSGLLWYLQPVWDRIKYRFISKPQETVFKFLIDEGCGNLTVWRVGLFSVDAKLTDVVMRRTFDDADFARRGLPFHFKDFDQMMGEVHFIRYALYSLAAHRPADESEIDAISRILAKDGVRVPENSKLNNVKQTRSYIFNYMPDYRAALESGWTLTINASADNGTVDRISVSGPNVTYP